MNRTNFNSIFQLNNDGSISPLQIIRIGGVQIGPGVKLGRGVLFGGIDLYNFIGREFETNQENEVLVINGIYEQ